MADLNLVGIDQSSGQLRPISASDIPSNSDESPLVAGGGTYASNDGEIANLEYLLPPASTAAEGEVHEVQVVTPGVGGISILADGTDLIYAGDLQTASPALNLNNAGCSARLRRASATRWVVASLMGEGLLSDPSVASLLDALAFWDFDGGTVTDLSGNGKTLVAVGTPTYAGVGVPASGNSVTVTNATNYLRRTGSTDDAVFDFGSNPFTLSVWGKLTVAGFIMEKGPGSSDGWHWTINANGSMLFSMRFVVEFTTTTGNFSFDGNWKHFVVRRSGNTWTFWVNGTLFDTKTQAGTILNSAQDIKIGASVTGQIDSPGAWGRALTNDEIVTLYNGGNGISYGGATVVGSR